MERAPSQPNLAHPEVNGWGWGGGLIGLLHLNQAGTRQEEGVGILLLSAYFLLFCTSPPFFPLIPLFKQEVIGIKKKNK